jgi:hypothetical protein
VNIDTSTGRRFRYDSPEHVLTEQEAIRVLLTAANRLYPGAFLALRDLPTHPLEGLHLLALADVPNLSTSLARTKSGWLHVVSREIGAHEGEVERGQDVPGTPPPDATPKSLGPAIFWDDEIDIEIGRPARAVMAVMVPRSVHDWAVKRGLSTPQIESAAVLIRAQWVRRPDAAKDGVVLFSSLRSILGVRFGKMPNEEEWKKLGCSSLGAIPMLESEEQFAQRARHHYQQRVAAYYERGPDGAPEEIIAAPTTRELGRHAEWLARVQIGGESPAAIAKGSDVTRQTVDGAVRNLAKFLELSLRRLKKSGRPPGTKNSTFRRTASQK